MPYLYHDYSGKINFTTEESSYEVGTSIAHLFTSEETTLLATVDCMVKFNNEVFWQKIYGNDYFVFKSRIDKITFKGESLGGTLEIWAEGNEITEQITELQNQVTNLQNRMSNVEHVSEGKKEIVGDYFIIYKKDNPTVIHLKFKLIKDASGNIIGREPA